MNGLKMVKINILACIAFPLLLLATIVKLLAKSMEKTIIILSTVLLMGGIVLLIRLFTKPGELSGGLLMLVILLILSGIFTAIVLGVMTMISSAVMRAVRLTIGVMESLYELIYAGYVWIYQGCYDDYCKLEADAKVKQAGCFAYTALRLMNRAIVFFATHAIQLMVLLCVMMLGYSVVGFRVNVKEIFGLSVISYLKLFPAFEIVTGLLLFWGKIIGISALLVSLGVEWNEWGREMSMETSDYEKQMKKIRDELIGEKDGKMWKDTEGDEEFLNKCNHYVDLLNYHIKGIDDYMENIMPFVQESDDYILRSNSGAYMSELYKVIRKIKKRGKKLSPKDVEKQIPQIDRMEELRKKVEQQIEKRKERKESSG